jgi:protoporphyrinogen oxidase
MGNVKIRKQTPVRKINILDRRVTSVEVVGEEEPLPVRYLISTIDLNRLSSILPVHEGSIADSLSGIDYLGVVCGLLKLERPVTDSFWVNVNDEAIPFNGFIEYSNLNQHLNITDESIVYVPYYIMNSDKRFSMSDEELLLEFVQGLNRINPSISQSSVIDYQISRATGAQAVCTVGFSHKVPRHETPLDGLLITDSTQYYPEDRTISAAIRLGRRVASIILAHQAARRAAAKI